MAMSLPSLVSIATGFQPRPRFSLHGNNQSFTRHQRSLLLGHKKNLSVTRCLEAKEGEIKETYEGEFEAAIEAVERACRLCLNVRTKMSTGLGISMEEGQRQKKDLTPVTVADYGVQALVALELSKRFQGVPLLGEEDAFFFKGESGSESGPSLATFVTQEVISVASLQLGTVTEQNIMNALEGNEDPRLSDKYWILDPIDGTRGFVRGGDSQCVVGLALVHKGELVVGVMGLPFLPLDSHDMPLLKPGSSKNSPSASKGVLLAAAKNGGTWVRPIRWSSEQNSEKDPSFVETNGKNGAPNDMERVHVSGDLELANACVCISDHETWEELPLAQALKEEGIGEGLARNLLPLCCGSSPR